MMSERKQKIAVIGAGFSGLTIAWALRRAGVEVSIFDSASRTGGMISSQVISGQLVESAANAILADQNVESLIKEMGLVPISSGNKSNARFIYRKKPRRVPLNFLEVLKSLVNFIFHYFIKKNIKPQNDENVSHWISRILSDKFDQYAVSPALQGVYAVKSSELSAELIADSFFNKKLKVPRLKYKGSISFKSGMQELTDRLTEWLLNHSVEIHLNSPKNIIELQEKFDELIIATSLEQAKILLEKSDIFHSMRELKSVSLTSVAVQPKSERKLRGFGCLFPKAENFKSLGVLFNSDIFEGRGHPESESWILPGAVAELDSINEIIRTDRKRLTDQNGDFLIVKYFVWLKSLPLYDINLKNFLRSKIFFQREQKDPMIDGFCISMNEKKVYLTGNYLAGIGLAKILSYNLRLSDRIVRDLQ